MIHYSTMLMSGHEVQGFDGGYNIESSHRVLLPCTTCLWEDLAGTEDIIKGEGSGDGNITV